MPNPIHIHEWATLSEKERARLLRRAEDDLTPFLEAVRPVIAAVASEGDDALRRYARQFDQAALLAIKVAPEEIAKAPAALSREMVAALEYGIANIRTFHERQKPEAEWWMETRPGLWAGERWVPIDDVACYVPRGKGSFPSVAMMALIPAVVAGVARIGLFTPPGSDGKADQATLAVAALLGIENVYLCGGALAVAAAAHGTETVPRFAKIVGPGSPYFMAAKKLLADRIDPGIPAGPTEALVVADETADAALVAVDLLIEAEHGPDSSCFLVTDSARLAYAVHALLPERIAELPAPRADYTAAVLSGTQGGIILAPDRESVLAIVNRYAAEHVLIHSADSHSYVPHIRHAGEILLGPHTPNTLANFVLGPNAILPTAGGARLSSALSVYDFMKRIGLGYASRRGFADAAPHAQLLAEYEGFAAHARAVSVSTRPRSAS